MKQNKLFYLVIASKYVCNNKKIPVEDILLYLFTRMHDLVFSINNEFIIASKL